jgi:hypothetical protein
VGCAAVETLQKIQSEATFQSGGPAAEPPLSVLALAVNAGYAPDNGPDAPTAAGVELVQRFARDLAQKFPADFPDHLRPYGVAVSAPGKGVPLLRVYVSTARKHCYETSNGDCETEARIDGSLIGSSGKRDWWFTEWITLDSYNDSTFRAFYKQLAGEMAKAQVVIREE